MWNTRCITQRQELCTYRHDGEPGTAGPWAVTRLQSNIVVGFSKKKEHLSGSPKPRTFQDNTEKVHELLNI